MTPPGRCPRCLDPLDDHRSAEPCRLGKKTRERYLTFSGGVCTTCSRPKDDHTSHQDGLSCPQTPS